MIKPVARLVAERLRLHHRNGDTLQGCRTRNPLVDDRCSNRGRFFLSPWPPSLRVGSRQPHYRWLTSVAIFVVHDIVCGRRGIRTLRARWCSDIDEPRIRLRPRHGAQPAHSCRPRSRDRNGSSARGTVVDGARWRTGSGARYRGARPSSIRSHRGAEAARHVVDASSECYNRAECSYLLASGRRSVDQRGSSAELRGRSGSGMVNL